MTRGGLPLPTVVEMSNEIQSPKPVLLQPCWATSDEDQRFIDTGGLWELDARKGICLLGNSTDRQLYTAACSMVVAGSDSLNMSADGRIRVEASNTCLTATNCTVHNVTEADCTPGSSVELHMCTGSDRVLQTWKPEAAGHSMSKRVPTPLNKPLSCHTPKFDQETCSSPASRQVANWSFRPATTTTPQQGSRGAYLNNILPSLLSQMAGGKLLSLAVGETAT